MSFTIGDPLCTDGLAKTIYSIWKNQTPSLPAQTTTPTAWPPSDQNAWPGGEAPNNQMFAPPFSLTYPTLPPAAESAIKSLCYSIAQAVVQVPTFASVGELGSYQGGDFADGSCVMVKGYGMYQYDKNNTLMGQVLSSYPLVAGVSPQWLFTTSAAGGAWVHSMALALAPTVADIFVLQKGLSALGVTLFPP